MPKKNLHNTTARKLPQNKKNPTVYLDPPVEQNLLHRLNRLEGHIRGVRRMLQEHEPCEDLLVQIYAVRAAINQIGALLLNNHLETCVAACIRDGMGDAELAALKIALSHAFKS